MEWHRKELLQHPGKHLFGIISSIDYVFRIGSDYDDLQLGKVSQSSVADDLFIVALLNC